MPKAQPYSCSYTTVDEFLSNVHPAHTREGINYYPLRNLSEIMLMSRESTLQSIKQGKFQEQGLEVWQHPLTKRWYVPEISIRRAYELMADFFST